MMRRAKIVCTLGPASNTLERIRALVEAGMDCARLNFSHGDHQDHAFVAKTLREVAARAGRPLSILADLSGPKMRVGRFPGGPIELVPGRPFILTAREIAGDEHAVSVTYKPLPRDVQPGDPILLDDGLLQLRVEKVVDDDVHCVVEIGGPLSNNKGLNMPGAALSAPALTEKDKLDAAFAVNELVRELQLLAVDHKLAGLWRQQSGHDLEERGLARAVLADHADLGAGVEGQRDVLEHLTVRRVEAADLVHGVDELGTHGAHPIDRWGRRWHPGPAPGSGWSVEHIGPTLTGGPDACLLITP